ncbi:uncharacterized protein F4822DRAFT_435415 [Hypoxylon trugodes]|uniref:uncharacterized protein n=1 Tax=Hypoxylon trugodes TaxID=326681 RepID=UPI00219F3495|nr:uncharacterized protein F4822DRAFT_435415 [Hypoxylon trugodes]KAI1382588.1 hypothetical protein F4822DRAFT_435415 [Hypoxylon trugodes]
MQSQENYSNDDWANETDSDKASYSSDSLRELVVPDAGSDSGSNSDYEPGRGDMDSQRSRSGDVDKQDQISGEDDSRGQPDGFMQVTAALSELQQCVAFLRHSMELLRKSLHRFSDKLTAGAFPSLTIRDGTPAYL